MPLPFDDLATQAATNPAVFVAYGLAVGLAFVVVHWG